MSISERIKKEIESREVDISNIPTDVLKKVSRRFEGSDEEIERVLRKYGKPNSDNHCGCSDEEFIEHTEISSDCWLCGGYTY